MSCSPWFIPIVAALTGVIVGVLLEPFRQKIAVWISGPKLKLAVHDFRIPDKCGLSYVRIRITNTKIRTARECRAFLVNVEGEDAHSNQFKDTGFCDSVPLIWSYHPNRESADIPKGVPHYVDVFIYRSGKAGCDVQARDSKGRRAELPHYNQIFEQPKLRFTVTVTAQEIGPINVEFQVTCDGTWPIKIWQDQPGTIYCKPVTPNQTNEVENDA